MIRLGIVSALSQEARVLTRNSRSSKPQIVADGVWFLRSGIGAQRAGRAAESLVAAGAEALLSFGLCGGIDARLEAGDMVIPTEIWRGNEKYLVSDKWRDALLESLGSTRPSPEILLHAEKPICEAAEKQALSLATGAQAVDMESAAIGKVAAEHGLPFLALRCVLDDAKTCLPRAALSATDMEGRLRLWRLVKAVVRQPSSFADLVNLAGQLKSATTMLHIHHRELGSRFLCDRAK